MYGGCIYVLDSTGQMCENESTEGDTPHHMRRMMKMATEKWHEHNCVVCEQKYKDTWDVPYICVDCENEHAEWLEEQGLGVDWSDVMSPNYKPDALKGTKWEKMLNA
jgi:hypothetical protein